jgi:hypothetical protein
MASFLGASPVSFIGLTCFLFGGAALATGRALARNWRPLWQVLLYSALLAVSDRFLLYALFGGKLLSASGYAAALAMLLLFAALAYRASEARLMVRQYPWLYERAGPLSWRERGRSADQSGGRAA